MKNTRKRKQNRESQKLCRKDAKTEFRTHNVDGSIKCNSAQKKLNKKNMARKIVSVNRVEEQRVNCCSQCHSQVLEFLQGLLRREHIDQTDDLQAQRQVISPLRSSLIHTHWREHRPGGTAPSQFTSSPSQCSRLVRTLHVSASFKQ